MSTNLVFYLPIGSPVRVRSGESRGGGGGGVGGLNPPQRFCFASQFENSYGAAFSMTLNPLEEFLDPPRVDRDASPGVFDYRELMTYIS